MSTAPLTPNCQTMSEQTTLYHLAEAIAVATNTSCRFGGVCDTLAPLHFKAEESAVGGVCDTSVPLHHLTEEIAVPLNTSYRAALFSNTSQADMKKFTNMEIAKAFRKKREELGLTQRDAANAVGNVNKKWIEQSTISRFESGRLSESNLRTFRPLVDKWLNCPTADNVASLSPLFKRPRAVIKTSARVALETSFLQNQYPSRREKIQLGQTIGLEANVVTNWFKNKRRLKKEKEHCT